MCSQKVVQKDFIFVENIMQHDFFPDSVVFNSRTPFQETVFMALL